MLWFGLLGGAIAWTIHLLVAYVIAEWVCVSRVFAVERFLGLAIVAWLLIGLTLAMALVAGASTWVAYRYEKALRAPRSAWKGVFVLTRSPEPESLSRERCERSELARTGWIMSGLFLLTILVQSIPIFYWLEGC